MIELVSDLGGGKTAFVRGLAQGMGIVDMVHSPSFTISNVYKGHNLTLYHLDFYRLKTPGIMQNELAEFINDRQAVTAVEWAEIVEDILPADRLTVEIDALTETGRQITFKYSPKLNYLFPEKT